MRWLLAVFDLKRFNAVIYYPTFLHQFRRYRKIEHSQTVKIWDTYPCLLDRTETTPFDPHYFYQAAWLARNLALQNPDQHVDVGSSVQMIAVLSGFIDTVFVDFRPLDTKIRGLHCQAGDITNLNFPSNSVKSLSCLHVIEHIGLGRYGDILNPNGSHIAAQELTRILAPEGRLYISVPVGKERVCFNAHRVFSPNTITKMFYPLKLEGFSYVDDKGQFIEDGILTDIKSCQYACGMFIFSKPTED